MFCHRYADEDESEDEESLRAELRELKVSELKKRARAAGVAQEALDAADDLADPRAAVIELLMSLDPAAVACDAQSPRSHSVAEVSTPVGNFAGAGREPEPEQEGSASEVAMTPEQVRIFVSRPFVRRRTVVDAWSMPSFLH